MANDQPVRTAQAGPSTTPPPAPRSPQAEGLNRILSGEAGPNSPDPVRTQTALRLFARGVNYTGDITNPAFLASVDPQLAQNILAGQWEATKSFFASWSESIRLNAEQNFLASMRKLQGLQLENGQRRNQEERQRA